MARHSSPPFDPAGKVAVVTGAAGGIGAALVRALCAQGASVVVATDLDADHTEAVAEVLDAEAPSTRVVGTGLDVTDRDATARLVEQVEAGHGPIALWCANAGVGTAQGADAEPAVWRSTFEVNVMAHVHAAAALLPRWLDRGAGHLLVTASAAGLLTNLGDAPYSVTKHAAVAFAEWLSVTHGDDGIGVCCLCPQGVRTAMVFGRDADEFAGLRSDGDDVADRDLQAATAIRAVRTQDIVEPDQVAAEALAALGEGRFLALPHPEVAGYERLRAEDHDGWITGMRRLQQRLAGPGSSGPDQG